MFGIGGTELAIILIFAFLIFGPDKMPEVARTIGQFLRQFQEVQKQMNQVIQEEVMEPLKDLEPLLNPLASLTDTNKKSTVASPGGTSSETGVTLKSAGSDADAQTDQVANNAAEAKPSSEDIKAAIEQDAKQRKGSIPASEVLDASAESFAQRRVRLEAEHATSAQVDGSAITGESASDGNEGQGA